MIRMLSLRNELANRLRAAVPDVVIQSESAVRAPHVLSLSVPGAEAEAMLMHFDMAGVACSGGSACATGSAEPSHVLLAMGVERSLALGTIRFSFGHETTEADLARVAEIFPGIVERVRRLGVSLGRA